MNAVKSEKVCLKTSREVILCTRNNEFIKLNGLEIRRDRLLWRLGLANVLSGKKIRSPARCVDV